MECGHSPLVSIPRASAGRVGRPNAAATGPRKQRTETATGFKRSSGLSRKRCAGHRNRCAPSKWQPGLDGRGSYSKRKTNWLGKDESLIQDAVLTPVRSTQEFEVVLAEVLAATRPVLKSRMAFEIREGDPAPDYPGSMNKGKVVRCSGSEASARDGHRSWNSSRAEGPWERQWLLDNSVQRSELIACDARWGRTSTFPDGITTIDPRTGRVCPWEGRLIATCGAGRRERGLTPQMKAPHNKS